MPITLAEDTIDVKPERPILGATYRHYSTDEQYVVTGFCTREHDGFDLTLYASVRTGKQWCRPTTEFVAQLHEHGTRRFTLVLGAPQSIGLVTIAYLWTQRDGTRMISLPDDPAVLDLETNRHDLRREALVRFSDAFAMWNMQRVASMAAARSSEASGT